MENLAKILVLKGHYVVFFDGPADERSCEAAVPEIHTRQITEFRKCPPADRFVKRRTVGAKRWLSITGLCVNKGLICSDYRGNTAK